MLRRLRWPAWMVFILLISIAIIGIYQIFRGDLQAVSKQDDSKFASEFPGLNLKTETEETETYTKSISFPTTESEKINESIQNWIEAQRDGFLMDVKTNEHFLGNEYRAHLNIRVDTKELSENVYSLIFNAYQFAGGANGLNTVKTFVIDLPNNKILTIHDVLELDDDHLDVIRTAVREQLKQQEAIYDYVMEDLLAEALQDAHQWKWSIDQEVFTLYFDEYEIAAGAAGTIRVELPLNKVRAYLKEDIAKQLTVPKAEEESKEVKQPEDKEAELDPDGKYIALTFDDGPNPKVTPRILQTLKEHNAKATFFMLGSRVEYYPTIAKQVAEAGHEIGNHTENHADLTKLGEGQIKAEFEHTIDKIAEASGIFPTLFRPPYGAHNEEVVKVAADYENSIILWSVDSLDWKSRDADAVIDVVQRDVVPGSIVLMHDIHPSTADALPTLLTELEKEGYEFVTVSQLLALQEEGTVGPYYGAVD